MAELNSDAWWQAHIRSIALSSWENDGGATLVSSERRTWSSASYTPPSRALPFMPMDGQPWPSSGALSATPKDSQAARLSPAGTARR